MRYAKTTPRLVVKFVDTDTNEVLFEIKDRTWMNVGEIMNDGAVSSIMNAEFRGNPPENLMVLAVGEFDLVEE
jgi:uncharacterized FlaG/YvyC family protein